MTPAETRANHYARLNGYKNSREFQVWAEEVGLDYPAGEQPSLIGNRWEIDEAIYDEFLNLIPPIYTRGGFFICEECFGGFHAKFTRDGDRFWCEFARLPGRENAPRPEIV